MERTTGFEPVPSDWKSVMLPLNTISAMSFGDGLFNLTPVIRGIEERLLLGLIATATSAPDLFIDIPIIVLGIPFSAFIPGHNGFAVYPYEDVRVLGWKAVFDRHPVHAATFSATVPSNQH